MSEEERKKQGAPPTSSVTSSNEVDPLSDESVASLQERPQQQQQQQPVKAGDNKNAIHMILQASKNVPPQKHGTQVSAEEQAQLNEYCAHLLAQNSSVEKRSFLGSETEESAGNLESLQLLSVNEHGFAGTILKSMCSPSSLGLYCSDLAQIDPCCMATFPKPIPISSSDERKKNDYNGTKRLPPTVLDEYRDDCYNVLDECDFNCVMNSDYAAVIEDDHHIMSMNRDPEFDTIVEEGHHMREDLGEEPPVQHPHISPLSRHQDIRYIQLKPNESIFSSMTTEASMIQPTTTPSQPTRCNSRGLGFSQLKRRKSDASEAVMKMVAEIAVPVKGNEKAEAEIDGGALNVPIVGVQGQPQHPNTVVMDDESASSKPNTTPTRVEIHMDECEIDVEWTKGSVEMGGSESNSTSSLESQGVTGDEDDDDSANDPASTNIMTNNKAHLSDAHAQDKPTSTILQQSTGLGKVRDEMDREEEAKLHLPFFANPRLFMPSSDSDSDDNVKLEADESRSFSSSLSSRSASPSQSPCRTPCEGWTLPVLQSPNEHLLPYPTESSSHEEIHHDTTSASASSRPRANMKPKQTRKIAIRRGRSMESRNTGSRSSMNDPEGDVSKSRSFHLADTSEPEGDLQISSSYHFDERTSPRSGSKDGPNTQYQHNIGSVPQGGNRGGREPGVDSPISIVESESAEGTFISWGSSTSSCLPKSTSNLAIMSNPLSPYYSSFSAFQSSQSNQSQHCYSDGMLDDSSASPSQVLSDVLRNDSNDETSESSFTGNNSINDFTTDRSHLSPTSPTGHCLTYLDGDNILDPSSSYGNSVATDEKINQEAKLGENLMLDALTMGTLSTERMTDTGDSTSTGTSPAGSSKKNPLDNFSSSTAKFEKNFRRIVTRESSEVDKERRRIKFSTNQRHNISRNGGGDELPVVDDTILFDAILFNSTPSPKQASKCLSPLQNRASRSASISSEEWADSQSSESSLILDDSSDYSSHESNLVISESREELSIFSLTAKSPAEVVAAPALAQPYSIASLQLASSDSKLEKQEYPLVTSLIRKVSSYDAQIIADKTRRQLHRTASESMSELGLTSLSNRSSNAHGDGDGGDTGGSHLQVSPAGRSLITMFSSSSSSSSCSSSPSKAESYHTAGEHVSSHPVGESELPVVDDSESEISIMSIQPMEPTGAHSGVTAVTKSEEPSQALPVVDDSESEISIMSIEPMEPTDVHSWTTAVTKSEKPSQAPFSDSVLETEWIEDPPGNQRNQPDLTTSEVLKEDPNINCVEESHTIGAQDPPANQRNLAVAPSEVLKEDDDISCTEEGHNNGEKKQQDHEKQHLKRAKIIDCSSREEVEVHIAASSSSSGRQSQGNRSSVSELSKDEDDADDRSGVTQWQALAPQGYSQHDDVSSCSSSPESQRNQSPFSELSKVDGDDQDREENDDAGGNEDDDDQLSLQLEEMSQNSAAELPPILALSSTVSHDDSQSEIIGYESFTYPLAPIEEAPSTDARNDESSHEDTVHSDQQLPWSKRVLATLKRLVKCKPRSEPTLIEPLLPRTIHNLDETALWQIRYNLEPPVDEQFHDDLLYIIEEGHLTSRSASMLEQGQATSVCTRVVRKCCKLGGFWYFFGLAFLVSALVSCGLVGL